MGRAIGGQAIVRIRELSGVAAGTGRDQPAAQGVVARDRDAARLRAGGALADLGQSAPTAACNMPTPPMPGRRKPPTSRMRSIATCELLDSGDRGDMDRALQDTAAFAARLPIVVGGERRFYDVHALNVGGGSVGIAIDASEATALSAALVRMAEAHRRTLDQLSSGVAVFDGQRRLAFYNDSYRRLWDLDRTFLDSNPDNSSVLDRLRAARKLPEQPDFRAWKAKLHEAYRAVEPRKGHLVSARRPRAERRHHAQSGRRRHLSVRRCHRKPGPGAPVRRPDPRPARDAR